MKKGIVSSFFKEIGATVRRNPVLALRYHVDTALYHADKDEEPMVASSMKGALRLSLVRTLAVLSGILLFLAGMGIKRAARNKKKTKK